MAAEMKDLIEDYEFIKELILKIKNGEKLGNDDDEGYKHNSYKIESWTINIAEYVKMYKEFENSYTKSEQEIILNHLKEISDLCKL